MTMVLMDAKKLDELYQKALADIPANHSTAIVATIDSAGASVELAFKKDISVVGVGMTWRLAAAWHLGFNGEQDYGAKLVISG